MYRILFILGIVSSFTSCQFSKAPTSDVLYLNQCAQNNTAFIHRINQSTLVNLEVTSTYKPYYKPILVKAKNIEQLTKSTYDSITQFYHQMASLPLDIAVGKGRLSTFQTLKQQAIRLQKKSIELIDKAWDNGGIKGTVFSDSTKREGCIQRIEVNLSPISPLQDKQLVSSKHSVLLTTLNLLQQKVKQNESVFINFLASQIGRMTLGGSRFFATINSSKNCIRLGETYEASIIIPEIIPHHDYKIKVGDSTLEQLHPYRTLHHIPTEVKGEQAFSISILIENPLTKEQTFIRQPFYFEVTR